VNFEISVEMLECQQLELKYMNQNGSYINKFDNIYTIIYPIGWFSNKNYYKKIEILKEAIDNGILIINTKSYQDLIEGIE